MRKIIWTRPDGGISITTPVISKDAFVTEDVKDEDGKVVGTTRRLRTEAEAEQRAWDKLPPDAIDPKFVNDTDIPPDRTFRDAWVSKGGKPATDMPKAKVIAHTIRRRIRDKEMKPHDDVIAKDIPGTDKVKAEAERVKIRSKNSDMQAKIDAAGSEAALRTALEL